MKIDPDLDVAALPVATRIPPDVSLEDPERKSIPPELAPEELPIRTPPNPDCMDTAAPSALSTPLSPAPINTDPAAPRPSPVSSSVKTNSLEPACKLIEPPELSDPLPALIATCPP